MLLLFNAKKCRNQLRRYCENTVSRPPLSINAFKVQIDYTYGNKTIVNFIILKQALKKFL